MSKLEKTVRALERCPHCCARTEVYARACPACGRDLLAGKVAALEQLRATGAVTDGAFAEMQRLLREPDDEVAEPPTPSPIRKQVTALLPGDIKRFPIWEYALDEEGEEGQDETTVRPRPDLKRAEPHEGLFVVAAEFVTADGTRFDGFASPHEEAHVGYTQPTIVTDQGQVNFWFGLFPPKPAAIARAYHTLGKTAPELFPLRYRALVEHAGAILDGELPAFLHYKSRQDKEVAEVT
jgi:hypothetical protein